MQYSVVNYIMSNSEIIKNIALFLMSAIISFVGLLVIIKILSNNKQIKKINENIEEWRQKLDKEEVNGIKGIYDIDLDVYGTQQKTKKMIEQKIQELKRKKNYLLEEISIYKIFKK